ncbi:MULTISPECIES: AraC family transcriptional regulator [Streptomyces]|uniref:AraC family transcriptional regulator n=1 Tax=Streptomyces edwardsiae TaxID=3075527 RepID=A0ABU2QK98_9ACTN|nr:MULTISPECIES: AraC family transcriptional regulator [unclassified Streptomyces]MDT0403395.1 AraC family transcriptional regulator [Streptomyces sp. DSM 41635]
MDPLEDVLALLETRGHLSAGLVAGGRWAVRFDAPDGVKFNAVRRGSCLLSVEGTDTTVSLSEGDCYLLTRPLGFTLRSDDEAVPVAAAPLFAAAPGGPAHAGEGEDTVLIGGGFSFGERARALLLDPLPPVIHIPAGSDEAGTLSWALTQIDRELRDREVASTLVAEHLAVVMLVHVLRLHLAREPHAVAGWLAGLADPVVATALTSMHTAPGRAWTVAGLARAGAVSRSTLAARFKDAVGQGPLDYLTGWRIELASARLREGTDTLATIARAVGYGSESALSTAFKRVTGSSPRAYRDRHRARHP